MRVGLVLEGGGMRGMYTCGVIDTFLENDIKIDGIIGVSAGALFGINYCSKQKGRGIRYNKKYIKGKDYMSISSLLKTGNMVNEEFAFHLIPEKLDDFDEEEFGKSNVDFYATVTNINTGKAEYIKIENTSKQASAFQATSAMPFLCKSVEIDGSKYMDGAIADSIPLDKCMEMGYDKIIVVLTKPLNFRTMRTPKLPIKLVYKNYPNLIDTINNRYRVYNETLDKIDELEKVNEIFVIRPSKDLKVKRIEKNVDKIQAMYDLGISDSKELLEDLKDYLLN